MVLSPRSPSAQYERFHSTNLFIHGTCGVLNRLIRVPNKIGLAHVPEVEIAKCSHISLLLSYLGLPPMIGCLTLIATGED